MPVGIEAQLHSDDALAAVEEHGPALLMALSKAAGELSATDAWTVLNADRAGRRKLVELLAHHRVQP